MDDVTGDIQHAFDGLRTARSPEASVAAVSASLAELGPKLHAACTGSDVTSASVALVCAGIAAMAADAAEAARTSGHRPLTDTYAGVACRAAKLLHEVGAEKRTAADAIDRVRLAVDAAAGTASKSGPRLSLEGAVADAEALLELRRTAGSEFAAAAPAVSTALTAAVRIALETQAPAAGALALRAGHVAVGLRKLMAAQPRYAAESRLVQEGSEGVQDAQERETAVVAGETLQDGATHEPVRRLLDEGRADTERREAALEASRAEQQRSHDAAVAAKRAARSRAKSDGTGPASAEAEAQSRDAASAGRCLMQPRPWMLGHRNDAADGAAAIRVTLADVLGGVFEDEPPAAAGGWAAVFVDTVTCAVHAAQRADNTLDSAYFSLHALAAKLPYALRSGAQECGEWAAMALALADVLVGMRDVSHALHCAAVARLVLERVAKALDSGADSLAAHVAFAELNARVVSLKMLVRTPADAPAVPLFRNAYFPPEELSGASAEAVRDVDAWGGRPERVRLAHLAESAGLLAVEGDAAAPPVMLRVPPAASASAARQALAIDISRRCHELAHECSRAFNVATDCEHFVRLQRLRADTASVLHEITGEAHHAEQRIAVLTELRSAGLDSAVFRNVLRQAEFDSGVAYMALAEQFASSDAARRDECYRAAADLFGFFAAAFRRELDAAARERVRADIAANDANAFLVAEGRRAQCLLRLTEPREAAAAIDAATRMRDVVAAAGPEGRLQVEMMRELAELLRRDAGASGAAPPAATHASKTSTNKRR